MKAERVSPCAAASSSIAYLCWPAGIAHDRDPHQDSASSERRANLAIHTQFLRCAWARNLFTGLACVLDPQSNRLDGIAIGRIGCLAGRGAAGKIRHDDAIGAGLPVKERNVSHRIHPLCPAADELNYGLPYFVWYGAPVAAGAFFVAWCARTCSPDLLAAVGL